MKDKAEILDLMTALVSKFDLEANSKDGFISGDDLIVRLSEFVYHTTKVSLDERKEAFKLSLKPFLEEYGRDLLNNFFFFWSNVKGNSHKMAFEKEKTWNVAMRLHTWKQNQIKFNAVNMVNKLNK